MPDGSATAHLYRPKLATTLLEGYGWAKFRADAVAGLTVAVVALPLSMAIAIASGVSPERGLYTAIVGGFLVSALGGSRYQIGGPAGAFIVLVAATGTKYGLEGLLLAVLMSGILLTMVGALRLGLLIGKMPHAVTIGFTCGIAVTIFASQLKDLAGLTLAGPEPGPLVEKLGTLWQAMSSLNLAALLVGLGTAAAIMAMRAWRPAWPAMLLAVAAASALGVLFHFHLDTIGSRFGAIPGGLPHPRLPRLSGSLWLAVLPSALSFTLLGAIESLLSAKVADGMTGRKHRSNMELVAQGIANLASACFGGISVTGTIARTATNVRAGARTPVSGMMHAGFLLMFLLVAARMAAYVPLASLAGLLAVVCWNMIEKREIRHLLARWPETSVFACTLLLTLWRDLSVGVLAGCTLAAIFHLGGRKLTNETAAAPLTAGTEERPARDIPTNKKIDGTS
jgi:SulP family sulfate permease